MRRVSELPKRSGGASGFALLLALSLMAFILVLILSFTLVVQVETSSGSVGLDRLRAKESARLALMIALGELQKHAGPDQRVTARADILGDGNYDPGAKFWTGVWDTTNPNAPPTWLVSGQTPDPSEALPLGVNLSENYDANNDDVYDEITDAPAVKSSLVTSEENQAEYAWWISDEGVKASILTVEGVSENIDDPESDEYLDYNSRILYSAKILHDPVFDFEELYDHKDKTSAPTIGVSRAINTDQLEIVTALLDPQERDRVESEFIHSVTLQNQFVLSDPNRGGLKKDLSYLKTIDLESITDEQVESLYNDPDDLLNSETARLIQFRGEPTAGENDDMIGMQLAFDTISEAELAKKELLIAPVITEFQLSCGIAADDQAASSDEVTDSELYFIYKLYLELWNPYSLPFLLGESSLETNLGYSDLRIEIGNLPSFNITNDTSAGSATGSIPDISILWSEFASSKQMRPGMVYLQTLPLDSKGNTLDSNNNILGVDDNNGTGALQKQLDLTISGSIDDRYTGSFSFGSSPLTVTIYGVNLIGEEKEILRCEINGYDDFTVDYDPSSRATRFKRRITSKSGQFGMNHDSLETVGYAFAFRFRMLDEQEIPGPFEDISNWLSKHDFRSRSFEVDLQDWDINDAWDLNPPLPYDFSTDGILTDPSEFNPAESFKESGLFHYKSTSGAGRKDRIARIVDLPVGEITDLGIFRSARYSDYLANAAGNSWGGDLNRIYDRYFFSTLPNPQINEWDGSDVLLNSRIKRFDDNIPELENIDTAEKLILINGFNLNSTSALGWEKILSGQSYDAEQFQTRYEQGDFPDPPEWSKVEEPIDRVFFNHPQTAPYNATERESDPRYKLVTRGGTTDYEDAFSIDSADWLTERQHPAFIQSFRELTEQDIKDLSSAVVSRIQSYYEENNHPPFSMADFLNAAILQDAIDLVPSINNRNDEQDYIPRYSPSSITQSTIMNLLGNFSFVRSDTFTIRAYGQIRSEVSGIVTSKALCEAQIQRLPEKMSNDEFGRQFKIVNFTWIEDEY